jgi:hypothetical protein
MSDEVDVLEIFAGQKVDDVGYVDFETGLRTSKVLRSPRPVNVA